ncbi:MAG: DUF898 domain-containing protein [Magnetococcales bacterium]|nr:DUF898 domain-containing protein [Magnetococcales bacterium]
MMPNPAHAPVTFSPEGSAFPAPITGAPPPLPEAALRPVPFTFTGSAGEYFRIWIVNVCLTILTLGIYSAWAKVRRQRYLYRSTLLAGSPFDYHADPRRILKGRLFVFLFLVIAAAFNAAVPELQFITQILFFAIIPWLIVRSQIFNLANSSYHNLRFHFHPDYRGSYRVYLVEGILSMVTGGLLTPLFVCRSKQFFFRNCHFGRTPARFTGSCKRFFRILLVNPLLLALLGFLFVYLSSQLLALLGTDPTQGEVGPDTGGGFGFPPFLPLFGGSGWVFSFLVVWGTLAFGMVEAWVINHIWSHVELGRHRFRSTLNPFGMAWIRLTNTVATLVTLGLLTPWARIRLIRYRLAALVLLVPPGEEAFLAAVGREDPSALSEELGSFMDADFGL